MEAIWVAAEMRAGGAYAHSALALHTITRQRKGKAADLEEGHQRPETNAELNAVQLEVS